jgi:hypothetical protein
VGQGTLENQKLQVEPNIKGFANIFIAFLRWILSALLLQRQY